MYEELVKRLRATTVNHDEKCESCSYEDEYPCCVDCLDEMHIEAAYAIEDLTAQLDQAAEYLRDNANALEELNYKYQKALGDLVKQAKPKWIPVTERLPEEYTSILFVSSSGQVHVGYYDSEHKSCCDMTGFRYVCTHWMPLPEQPKEET